MGRDLVIGGILNRTQPHTDAKEPLLGAVVKVAFKLPALFQSGVKESSLCLSNSHEL